MSTIITHLKSWIAVARHNFKWVKIVDVRFRRLKSILCLASATLTCGWNILKSFRLCAHIFIYMHMYVRMCFYMCTYMYVYACLITMIMWLYILFFNIWVALAMAVIFNLSEGLSHVFFGEINVLVSYVLEVPDKLMFNTNFAMLSKATGPGLRGWFSILKRKRGGVR